MIYLLPFFTVLIWGGNSIVNKLAASTIEPSAMSFYRWLLAMAILTLSVYLALSANGQR